MDDLLSSPDPLNDSPTFHTPEKTRRSSRVRQILPVVSSPTKQTFDLDVGNQISPQKIRVTVEAGQSDRENGYTHHIEGSRGAGSSPTHPHINRRRERTITTTIPVKGLSDSEEDAQIAVTPKRGRGRPRKSAGTPVPTKKAGYPGTSTGRKGRRRKSIGDLIDGDDEEDYNFQIGKGVQVGRGKGRSRSRSVKGASQKATLAMQDTTDVALSSTTSKERRRRRKSMSQDEVIVLEDENNRGVSESEDRDTFIETVLQPIADNETNATSLYSNHRPSTTSGADNEDIVVARIDPENEIPRSTGWMSPHIREVKGASSLACKGYPSPSSSPEKNEIREAVVAGPTSVEQFGTTQDDHDMEHFDMNGKHEVGEISEFDTILESEGFSMISVHSVLSLREHISSPVNQEEKQRLPLAITSKILESVKGPVPAEGDSFSSIPDDVLKAATPARKAQNTSILSVRNSLIDDSLPNIRPKIPDVSTPARRTLFSKLRLRRDSEAEDSFSSIAPEVLEAATPGRDLKSQLLQPNSQMYGGSFSAISSAVLGAAATGPACQTSPKSKQRPCRPVIASDGQTIHALSPSNSSRRKSTTLTSTRLPTPEETPSPAADSGDTSLPPCKSVRERILSEITSLGHSDQLSASASSSRSAIRSSPPSIEPRGYTNTAHLLQRPGSLPDIVQTPSIVFSSPSLPPPIDTARSQSALTVQKEVTARPGLSPIARAGRVLQDALAPTLSPRGGAHSLGSPFKSPAPDKRSSSSIAPLAGSPTQDHRATPIRRSNGAGHLFSNPQKPVRHNDDRFSINATPGPQTKPTSQRQVYALGLPEQQCLSSPQLPTIISGGKLALSDNAMSCQAEEAVTTDDGTTSLLNHVNSSAGTRDCSSKPKCFTFEYNTMNSEQQWAAERATVRRLVESGKVSQVIVINSDEEEPQGGEAEHDDEDFGLFLETLNSSSPEVHQARFLDEDNMKKSRRGKLPSLPKPNCKTLSYSDETLELSSTPPSAPSFLENGMTTRSISDNDNAMDLSSIVISQKHHFKPRIRESGGLDLSALLASSPNKSKLPVLTQSSNVNISLPQKLCCTATSVAQTVENDRARQQPTFAPIPQKLGFNPRRRDPGDAKSSSIFGSSPVRSNKYAKNLFAAHSKDGAAAHNSTPNLSSSSTAPVQLSLSSPIRNNKLCIPPQIASAQHSESECSRHSLISPISVEEEKCRSVDNFCLGWHDAVRLATVTMQPLVSPMKSCLRSPTKTPSNASGSACNGTDTSPSKNVAFVSSSPIPSSPTEEPLSSTTWSREHWILLDSILQSWKPENNGGSEDGPKQPRRNSTRVVSRILGKRVSSQGEDMRLKQWHLEVVDEFRGLVPGWEEKVVAMRVFSLILGEEHRNRGIVGLSTKEAEQIV